MTRQLSSSWTLAFRIFFPTLWITFFGIFTIAVLFTSKSQFGEVSATNLGLGLLAFVVVFVFIFWKTVFRLKRIDADDNYVYVTNYFKYIRYPHEDVECIEVSKGIMFNFGHVMLKGSGRFGSRIPFILSRKRLDIFLEDHPELRGWLVIK